MTTQELEKHVNVELSHLHGHYKITINYRGRKYRCLSTNSSAYDSVRWPDDSNEYTYKQGLQAFYDECKRKNNLV